MSPPQTPPLPCHTHNRILAMLLLLHSVAFITRPLIPTVSLAPRASSGRLSPAAQEMLVEVAVVVVPVAVLVRMPWVACPHLLRWRRLRHWDSTLPVSAQECLNQRLQQRHLVPRPLFGVFSKAVQLPISLWR